MDTELQVAKWHIIKFVVIIVLIISSWKYGIEIFRGQSRRLTEWDNCNVVPATIHGEAIEGRRVKPPGILPPALLTVIEAVQ